MRNVILGLTVGVMACTGMKVNRVKSAVYEASQCKEVRVAELQEGWRADGCKSSWYCESANGPCEERSCADWEQIKYDKCIEKATHTSGLFSADLARAAMSGPMIDECRHSRDIALNRCGVPVPAPAAAAGI
jgi:hypothetical protein